MARDSAAPVNAYYFKASGAEFGKRLKAHGAGDKAGARPRRVYRYRRKIPFPSRNGGNKRRPFAHTVAEYEEFSTLQPQNTEPSAQSSAAPTGKDEYGE